MLEHHTDYFPLSSERFSFFLFHPFTSISTKVCFSPFPCFLPYQFIPICFPYVRFFPCLPLLYYSRTSPPVPLHVGLLHALFAPKFQGYWTVHCPHPLPLFELFSRPSVLIIIFLCLSFLHVITLHGVALHYDIYSFLFFVLFGC